MPIEIESPEQLGYSAIMNNLSESSVADRRLSDLGLDLDLDGRHPAADPDRGARPDVAVDTAAFYHRLLADHGTYVGPGHWFEVSDRYFRMGYGWPAPGELRDGLAGLTAAAEATLTAG